ncbi:hypothetical protein JAAARDRAFT_35361 [Jaapia argillacea MUCL 33604]|uniref:Uncharacterized protein n=1 Tax=Jaapia argillacea MUCL 33604 TaxID=933084 RepID=A0A067Q2F7_9AGAM|nr:hypothetical protein JAAARDRAFT_35361 [Jaapia argillacea MUCL 33604]
MADFNMSNIPLPAFLDPLLDYLSSTIPAPIYSFLMTILSHSLALFGALFSLFYALASSNPAEWDAQTILPPLISLLCAYLALVSVYRTTSWMFRTGVFFVKWGIIFGAITAGAGWLMGHSGTGIGGSGLTSTIGGILLDLVNGQGQNAAGGARSRGPSSSSSSRSHSKSGPRTERPKAWESFDRHREWQYEDNGDDHREGDGEVQKVILDVVGTAGKIMRESGWWDAIKGVVESVGSETAQADETAGGEAGSSGSRRKQPSRKAKSKAGTSNSR